MEQEQEKKEGKGCFSPGCLIIALAAIALIGYGFVMPGKTLPVISLSAELIPIHLPIPGFEHGVPNTLPTAIFTSLFLILIALFYNRAVKRAERTGKESRFLMTIDMIYEGVFSFIETTVGKENATLFFPLIGSFFFFILFANWSGLLPGMGSIGIWEEHHGHLELIPIFRSPTADLSTTIGLAIITQVTAQYYGFKFQGRKYLNKFFNFSADPDSGWLKPVLSFANGFAGILELMGEFSLLAVSSDLVMIFIAFELLSISSYILTGFFRKDPRSSEAAIKYFLYGSVASAMMLYGMSLLYGATATTNLVQIAGNLAGIEGSQQWVIYPALVMLIVGFGYKTVAVPFHQWSPDAYEGAPTPVTAFLAVGSIGAGFGVLVRVMVTALPDFQLNWAALIAGLSIMSMSLGNMVAISQKNIKRMLAYSGIAQAGYILIGVVSWSSLQTGSIFDGISGVLVYLLVYLAANLGAFAVVIAIEHKIGSNLISDYAGLIYRSPLLAGTMVVFLLSLIGIPGTGGFIGKLMVFGAALTQEYYFLAVIAIINSVIAGFYYLNVIRYMFFQPLDAPKGEAIQLPITLSFAIVLSCVFTLLMGIFAQPFIHFVQQSLGLIS